MKLGKVFSKRSIKDFDNNDEDLLSEIKLLNDKVDCLQKSIALLYQLLPNKIREGIIDGLNERNKRRFPF